MLNIPLAGGVETEKGPLRVRRLYSDVSIFFEGVCRDLMVLYPQCTKDRDHFIALFSRALGTNVPD